MQAQAGARHGRRLPSAAPPRPCIAVDLTALGPERAARTPDGLAADLGAVAPSLAVRLVEALAAQAPEVDFVVLGRPGLAGAGGGLAVAGDNVRSYAVPGPGPVQRLLQRAGARLPGRVRERWLAAWPALADSPRPAGGPSQRRPASGASSPARPSPGASWAVPGASSPSPSSPVSGPSWPAPGPPSPSPWPAWSPTGPAWRPTGPRSPAAGPLPVFRPWRPSVLARLGADAVLCPFTASDVRDPAVPLVVLLADLQHLSHPHLLTSMQRAARARALGPIRRSAARVVCPSEALRGEAIDLAGLPDERVVHLTPGRLLVRPRPAPEVPADTLARFGLGGVRYLLLPGGGAARHNQALALAAFGLFRARQPDSPLRLVCVGSPPRQQAWLQTAAERMDCGDAVRLLGPLPAATLVSLIDGAAGVLITALYETVGESALQAMALGRAVICSHLPSLLELVGDAALSFDPHRPTALAALLERLDRQPETLATAGRRGQQRLLEFAEPASVARTYLDLLLAARTWCPTSR